MTPELFNTITQWQDQTFPTASPLSTVLHLEEEVRELKEATQLNILDKHEIADCFLLLIGHCNKWNLKYEDVVNLIGEKFQIVQHRKYSLTDEKGYQKHIKE